MDFEERWHMLHELGEGGQGKVYRVLDLDKIRTEDMHPKDVFGAISEMIGGFTVAMQASHKNRYEVFKKAISTVNQMDDPANHGALKLLHKPEKARDYDLAKDRIKREIEGMSALSHPNLLKILDKDPDAEWYVSEFHPKGTLTENMHLFTGDIAAALKAFRPLVEGVSELHKQKLVHRDIKPENVFLDVNNNLVLGDFGLVFFTDVQHTRILRRLKT